jgi:hypothetical protein
MKNRGKNQRLEYFADLLESKRFSVVLSNPMAYHHGHRSLAHRSFTRLITVNYLTPVSLSRKYILTSSS